MIKFDTPVIERVDDFLILRDDLFHGGTKARILAQLLKTVTESNIVYAGHAYGYAAYALACACEKNNKRATVLFPESEERPEPLTLALGHSSLDAVFVKGVEEQSKLYEYAKRHVQQNEDSYLYPIGFCTQEFEALLIQYIKTIPLQPKEIWTLAGSGFLARTLKKAWPETCVNAVSMGFMHVDVQGVDNVINAVEYPNEKAKYPPPYPSASYYDAKVWHIARKHARQNALIWNVA